ncbi:MAG: hypothetical protein WA751_02875 [Candidatus Dormiibacterota bacterium]
MYVDAEYATPHLNEDGSLRSFHCSRCATAAGTGLDAHKRDYLYADDPDPTTHPEACVCDRHCDLIAEEHIRMVGVPA